MKTPDEIKKGLEHCMSARCDLLGTCPYEYECNHVDIHVLEREALDYIRQLEADNAQLNRCIENMTDKLNAAHDETVELKRERDALLEMFEKDGDCRHCKHLPEVEGCVEYRLNCKRADNCYCADCSLDHNKWEWAGIKEGDA